MAGFAKYSSFILGQINGSHFVDFDTDTIKISLVSSSYVPNLDTHEFYSSVTNEVVGDNYIAGGKTLQNTTATVAAGVAKFDADDVTWFVAPAGYTNARYAILYKSTGVAGSSPLIGVLDLGQNYGNSAGDFTLRFDATNGIFTVA